MGNNTRHSSFVPHTVGNNVRPLREELGAHPLQVKLCNQMHVGGKTGGLCEERFRRNGRGGESEWWGSEDGRETGSVTGEEGTKWTTSFGANFGLQG